MDRSDVLKRTAALGDTITACRKLTESDRRLAEPIVDGIRQARLSRLALSEDAGGLALPLPDIMIVLETLSGFEASVGWIVWNNTLPCLFSRHLPTEGRTELFAGSDWIYANSTRPTGKAVVTDGGFRMSGRWSLVSGCELAEWMPLMCRVEEAGQLRMTPIGPELRLLFVHRADVTILDTWHVGGLRGTGSHDVTVDDLFVPDAHTLTPADPISITGPYAFIPIIGTLALGFAAQHLGAAGAALEATVTIGKTKLTPDPLPDMRDRPGVQLGVAEAAAALAAARTHLHDVAARIWTLAESGSQCQPADLATLFAAARHAVRTSAEVADDMYAAAGTTSIYDDCALERIHRDLRVMRQHVIAQPSWAENAGRVILGLQPTEPLFAI